MKGSFESGKGAFSGAEVYLPDNGISVKDHERVSKLLESNVFSIESVRSKVAPFLERESTLVVYPSNC